MGLEFPSMFDVDTILWRHNDTSKDRSRKENVRTKVWDLILRENQFVTKPIGGGGGHSYTEPLNYLAIALGESGLRWNEKIGSTTQLHEKGVAVA